MMRGFLPWFFRRDELTGEAMLRLGKRFSAWRSCPGEERTPNTCRCPCYGCRHHCSAHRSLKDTLAGQ